jgi:cobalt-zinc-cadmium efflux system membrane fusion protein
MKKTMNIQIMILGLTLSISPWMVGSALAEAGEDSHEGHAHAAGEAQLVPVTQEQVARLGIKISRAVKGVVRKEIRVPGEIKVNSDRMAHVVPQTPGVVIKVLAALGQEVEKGQVLALISSRDLAEAKAQYLASVERLKLAEDIYKREHELYKKEISSEEDYLVAKQARAESKIIERSSRQKLLTYGLDPSKLTELEKEPDDAFALYQVVSPFAGTVIGKHIVLGEVIDEESEVYVIADLATVWVDLAISQNAISSVQEGHAVTVHFTDGSEAETKIGLVSPIVMSDTRTALARATLDNTDGLFRPGTFVEAGVHVPAKEESVVVPKASLQLVNDRPCVFVWGDSAFEMREVVTGVADGVQIEILKGLCAGEAVASENAFHLKAAYVKSMAGEVGAHQGHSH